MLSKSHRITHKKIDVVEHCPNQPVKQNFPFYLNHLGKWRISIFSLLNFERNYLGKGIEVRARTLV